MLGEEGLSLVGDLSDEFIVLIGVLSGQQLFISGAHLCRKDRNRLLCYVLIRGVFRGKIANIVVTAIREVSVGRLYAENGRKLRDVSRILSGSGNGLQLDIYRSGCAVENSSRRANDERGEHCSGACRLERGVIQMHNVRILLQYLGKHVALRRLYLVPKVSRCLIVMITVNYHLEFVGIDLVFGSDSFGAQADPNGLLITGKSGNALDRGPIRQKLYLVANVVLGVVPCGGCLLEQIIIEGGPGKSAFGENGGHDNLGVGFRHPISLQICKAPINRGCRNVQAWCRVGK